jgi:integrase
MAMVGQSRGIPHWLRFRVGKRDWSDRSTGIRVDSITGKREALRQAHLESANETDLRAPITGHAFREWVPSFLKQRYGERKPKSYQRYGQCWTALAIYLEDAGIVTAGQVTKKIAKDYPFWRIAPPAGIGIRKAKWNTALLEVKFFGLLLDEAVERGHIIANPCIRLGLKRERPKEKNAISLEDQKEIEKALIAATVPEWMRVSWKIAMRQGCRLSETSVPLDMIDLKSKPPTISFLAKGDRIHVAPLHPELITLCQKLKKAKAKRACILPLDAAKRWHQWLRNHGFKQYSFHCTRVTVVTRLAADNFSQAMVKDYVGHAS